MADDKEVRPGTRYDALRIVAMNDVPAAITQLKHYLARGTDRQLQMGAVSGLADIESDDVIQPLIESLPHLEKRNHTLAIEGLRRNDARKAALKRVLPAE